MNYFMNRENVNEYIEMLKDYDGTEIISKLKKYSNKGSRVLELGMGAGLDLELIAKEYDVLGSDNSPVFIDDFKDKRTDIKVVLLDAVNLDIDKKFDCMFSNKVLQHLTREDFIKSLKNQKSHLEKDGIIFMTLWHGEHQEELMLDGQLRFTYYEEKDIKEIAGDDFEVLTLERYTESEDMDSILVVLKAK